MTGTRFAPIDADRIEADHLTEAEDALIRSQGFYPWGRNAWINEDDDGTVYETGDALAEAVARSREANHA
ncbi:MAG: hypothetical protein QOF36_2628 [Microbacteriaceae bacterium]|jgi:hypothetical protein|nr:hypothetical protein [Microbacteriaceae bacterium]